MKKKPEPRRHKIILKTGEKFILEYSQSGIAFDGREMFFNRNDGSVIATVPRDNIAAIVDPDIFILP